MAKWLIGTHANAVYWPVRDASVEDMVDGPSSSSATPHLCNTPGRALARNSRSAQTGGDLCEQIPEIPSTLSMVRGTAGYNLIRQPIYSI